MTTNQRIEASRELRLWIGTALSLASIDICFTDGKVCKAIYNGGKQAVIKTKIAIKDTKRKIVRFKNEHSKKVEA